MRHHALHTDFVQTRPFPREDVITSPFRREPVDVDDTVPFALYSQPYERVELAVESAPYALIEIAAAPAVAAAPAPSPWIRVVFTISLLACALVAGFELALLVL